MGELTLTFALADQNFARTKSLGILNVSTQLLQHLARRPEVRRLTVLSNGSLHSLLDLPAEALIQDHEEAMAGRLGRLIWDQWGVYRAARQSANAWLFLPKGFASFLRRCPVKLAAFVHDTMQDYYQQRYPGAFSRLETVYFQQCFRATVLEAQVIFTNSQFTRQEVERLARAAGLPVPRIVVAGIGFDRPPPSPWPKQNQIVVLASPWPHKRTDLAFAYLSRWQRETGFNGQVDVVGHLPPELPPPTYPGWRWHARLDPLQYQHLLAQAAVLVYCSEFEGFGLPPVEAILAGTCPVYSDLPSTREVMAGLGCPFPNESYDGFAQALKAAFHMSRDQLADWAAQLLQRHDWQAVTNRIVGELQPEPPESAVDRLKILQVFNRYLQPGGEEKSVARIGEDLEAAGHRVIRFWRSSDEWQRAGAPARWRQLFLLWHNGPVLQELRRLHEREQPAVWVLHNVVPVVSLGVYRLAQELRVPIIHWLHNYRPISPSGSLFAGQTRLAPDDPWRVWKEAWHGSWNGRLLTAWLALAYAWHKWRGHFNSVRAWIAVSEEMKGLFARAGWYPERLHILHHSWHIHSPGVSEVDDGHFLFLGRMVDTKGVRFIVNLWRDPALRQTPLVMAGQGPLVEELRAHSPPNVRWVGHVEGAAKHELVARCRAILFPCLWAEPLSTVAYEAYELGKPILASNLGGMKEIIVDGQTGWLLEPNNPAVWLEAIRRLEAAPARRIGLAGRRWLEQNASPETWNRHFTAIVRQVMQER